MSYSITLKNPGNCDFNAVQLVRDPGLTSLDAAIVERAILDLFACDRRIAIRAALFFFLEAGPETSEFRKSRTFTALCLRNGINPVSAAAAIWERLGGSNRKRICQMLKAAGYDFPKKRETV